MADEFKYCPQCGSDKITVDDFEDEEREEVSDSLECDDCGWQGTDGELVCKDEEGPK